MPNTGKQSPQSIKPSPNPGAIPNEHDRMPHEQQGEGSYSGTRDYQKGVKAYLEHANVERDARDAAPDSAEEARELDDAEEAGRNGKTSATVDAEKPAKSRKTSQ